MRGSAQSLHQVHPHSDDIQPPDPPFPDFLAFNSTAGQRQTDLSDRTSEMVVVSSDLPASHDKTRSQQTPEGYSQVPSERQLNACANQACDPSLCSVPTFAWPMSLSLDHPLTDSTGDSQITVSPDAPVDLSVFDWKSIPNPLVENPISMSTCHFPSLTK